MWPQRQGLGEAHICPGRRRVGSVYLDNSIACLFGALGSVDIQMRDPVLIGADDVRNASHTMARAAETMSSAASSISSALEQHQRFLEDWLSRFEYVIDRARPSQHVGGPQ